MNSLQENISAIYGDEGKAWISAFPEFLKKIEKRLGINLKKPYQNLTFSHVAPATRSDGAELVFKCSFPNEELARGIEALKFFDGYGMVKLIQADSSDGWMLLERCLPGMPIKELHDDEATRIAIHTMQSFWKPVETSPNKFKHIKDWLLGLDSLLFHAGPELKTLCLNAKDVVKDLLNSLGEEVLLHGDLHHDNVLSAQREPWLAIDPKGVIGEREYEVGALMRNPISVVLNTSDLQALLSRRLSLVVELTQFNRERLLMWTFVQAVLAAWWYIDDGLSGADEMIQFATIAYKTLRTYP